MSTSLHSAAIGFASPPTSRNEAEQTHYLPTPCASSSWPPSDIFIDGSISYMFGPKVSEVYFSYLFKGSIRRSLLCWNIPDWPGACFTNQGILSTVAETFQVTCLEREPKAHLLDYDARSLEGMVVPQALWSPRSLGATNKYVLDATLQFPIFFVRQNRTVGVSLREAVEGPRGDLLGAQSYAPLGGQSTLHVRIQWPGYRTWKRQVQARDDTRWRNPITLAKFAQHVGRCVSKFLQYWEGRPSTDHLNWKIGGRGGILPAEVLVLGAVHVSSGTWQPILALTRVVL